jgi:hypothetical protein
MAAQSEETDVIIEIPELEGLTVQAGQKIRLMVGSAGELRETSAGRDSHCARLSHPLSQDLDTDKPWMEIGGARFVGQYQFVIGTAAVVAAPLLQQHPSSSGSAGAGAGAGAGGGGAGYGAPHSATKRARGGKGRPSSGAGAGAGAGGGWQDDEDAEDAGGGGAGGRGRGEGGGGGGGDGRADPGAVLAAAEAGLRVESLVRRKIVFKLVSGSLGSIVKR